MKNVKEQIQKIFSQNKQVTCPAFLDEPVIFNAKGINHLMYKGDHSPSWQREKALLECHSRLEKRSVWNSQCKKKEPR